MQLVIFYLYLMFHACAARFDVTENLKIFVNFFLELNKALNFVLHRMLR